MILVTGATGFIGKALVRHLVESGYQVRILLRPSRRSPDLPRGVAVEAALSSLSNERNLRAAMVGVDTIYHLASGEWRGPRADLLETDIQGTLAVAQAAVDAGVGRIFFLSHLGADRASAFPVLKAKAIAEEHLRRSGVAYTILRTGIVYGLGDHFTSGLARLLHALPLVFILPGDGETLVQPLWIEDLVTCLTWALDIDDTINQTYAIGGPEFFKFSHVVEIIMETIAIRRKMVFLSPPYLRALTVFLETIFPGLPVTTFWLDYLATNHTTALDTIPRIFNLMPARFSQRLAYLQEQDWRLKLIRTLYRRGVT